MDKERWYGCIGFVFLCSIALLCSDDVRRWFAANFEASITLLAVIATAIFTAVLAAATIGLRDSTQRLWEAGERQAEISRQAADAAKRSADALVASEAPYVFERFDHINDIAEAFYSGLFYRNSPEMDEGEPQHVTISIDFTFRNLGKTPAVVQSWTAAIEINSTPPTTPGHDQKMLLNFVLEPGQAAVVSDAGAPLTVAHTFDIGWSLSQRLASGESRIWLAGEAIYEDVFGRRRRRSFIWVYDRPMKAMVPFDGRTSTLT